MAQVESVQRVVVEDTWLPNGKKGTDVSFETARTFSGQGPWTCEEKTLVIVNM